MNDNIRELREEVLELLYDRMKDQINENADEDSLKVTMNLINDSERNHMADIKLHASDSNETAKIDIEVEKLEFERARLEAEREKNEREEERRKLECEQEAIKSKRDLIIGVAGLGVSVLGVIATLSKGAMLMKSNHNNLVDYLNIEQEVGKPQNDALRLGVTSPADLFK